MPSDGTGPLSHSGSCGGYPARGHRSTRLRVVRTRTNGRVLQRSTLHIRVRCNMHSLSHWIVVNERRLSAVSGRIRSGQWPCTRTTTSTRTHSSSPRVGIAPTRLLTQSRSCTEETPLLVSLLRCCWKDCQSKHGCTLHVSSLRCKRS